MAKAVKAVGNAFSGVVKGVVNVVKSVVKAVVNVVASVVSMVVQPFMGLLGGPPEIGSQQEAERQQGVLIQTNGGGAVPVPVVYGQRKVAGVVTFAETGSTNNRYLWVVYTFSEGPINGLRTVYLNDEELPATLIASLNAGTQVNISEGKFKGRVSMLFSPGVYFSNPATSTLGTTLKAGLFKDAPSFTNTMTHNGLACLFVRYEWLAITTQAEADANPFSGSIPVIQVEMLGRRVASLETSASESYSYGSGSYTERYSSNPAEILLDYLRNPRYGKGMANSEIDWDSFRTAAAKCNTQVTYTSTNIQGPIMTCNYVLDTSLTLFQNVKLLLQGFRAYLPYVQGKYKLKIEDAGHPTLINSGEATIIAECTSDYQIRNASLLENTYDIMGDVTYTGIERSAKYNAVVVTYVEPSAKYATNQVVYPVNETGPGGRQSYIDADGGRENKLEVTFGTITNQAMAWDMARLLFNKSRNQETCSLKVSSQAFELEPGDCIRIQSQILNFGLIPWRVINIAYNDDYTFDLSCVRNEDSLYPYTRVGEPDVVLPIFVPKGASIYYPVERDPLPIGLVPAATVPFTGGGTTLNPAPNNPTSTPNAGGVGGSGSVINTSPFNNNTPPGAPKPQPLTNTLDITNIQYVTKSNLVYARITTRQPDHAQYAGVDIYLTFNAQQGYQLIEDKTVPGMGATFTIDIGPLAIVSSIQPASNFYDAYFRVKYSTGELSLNFTRYQFNPATQAGAGTNPSELVQTVASSWPAIALSSTPTRDTKLDIIRFVVPVPTSGSQSNPRTGTVQFSQNVLTQIINRDVTGMNIYARSDAETYWTKTSYTFVNYAPGTENSFAYTGSLGVLNTGISGSTITPNGGAIYTFVFRLTYRDGTESTNQYVQTAAVQNPGYSASATGVNIFYGSGLRTDSRGGVTTGQMASGVFPTPEAPAGFTANAANIQTKMNATVASGTKGISFGLLAPAFDNRSNWQGMRFRYRKFVPGPSTGFGNVTLNDITIDANTFTPVYTISSLEHDTRYEVVATPVVVLNNRNFQDSNFSSHGVGLVSRNTSLPNYPRVEVGNLGVNWAGQWNWTQMDTGRALNELSKTIATNNPVPSITKCTARLNDLQGSRTQLDVYQWIEITYSCINIANFSKLQVFRRSIVTNPGTATALHYGVGRWELIETTNSSGNLSLRFPISYEEFNRTYTGTGNLTVGFGSGLSGLPTGNATDNTANGNSRFLLPLETRLENVQLLFRVVTTAGISDQAIWVRGQSNSGQLYNFDMLSPTKPADIEWNTVTSIRDSDFTAGYLRRLGEARGLTGVLPGTSDLYLSRSYDGQAYNREPRFADYKILGNTLPGISTV